MSLIDFLKPNSNYGTLCNYGTYVLKKIESTFGIQVLNIFQYIYMYMCTWIYMLQFQLLPLIMYWLIRTTTMCSISLSSVHAHAGFITSLNVVIIKYSSFLDLKLSIQIPIYTNWSNWHTVYTRGIIVLGKLWYIVINITPE